ncbi:cupin domain-containing protein [Pseudonocardia sp. NPDC049635]|uniref:cupin domain-containing protein n=1 Tax=Pseudonocardia sp. NPDC049635 TaxID=3155506 RepID=UPI0033FF7CB4
MRTRPRHALAGPALLVVVAALLAGCAQPGQLGHESDPGAPEAGAPASPGTTEPAPPGPGAPDPQGSAPQDTAPQDPTAAALPGAPGAPVAQAGSDTRATLDRPVEISTPGPAELLVRTEVLQPGQASGWVRHPGTAISAIRSGELTVQRAGRCEPQTFRTGEAFFLGDGEPNELRNDGSEPVVLTRSQLLAPGAVERETVEPAC